uniref:Apple domain-containing protein n=1 Tax=Romanomermis culicivorax TaxID=13658 RepID=A0A915IF11_ROMCU
ACKGQLQFTGRSINDVKSESDLLFYSAHLNVSSIGQCAKICYESEFCRSALYSVKYQQCDLAYGSGSIKCYDIHLSNSMEFRSTDKFIALHCIRCDEPGDAHDQPLPPKVVVVAQDQSLSVNLLDQDECFVEVASNILPNAAFAVQHNFTLDQCKCVCAETWNSEAKNQMKSPERLGVVCRSFNYISSRAHCILNFLDRKTGAKAADDEGGVKLVQAPKSKINASYFENICQENGASKKFIHKSCRPAKEQKSSDFGKSDNTQSSTHPTPFFDENRIENKNNNLCFEDVAGHVLNGLSGKLEYNTTLEMCKCFCSDPNSIDRYGFRCKSLMYYASENVCILNAGDRSDKPGRFFRREITTYTITYSELKCENDSAKLYHKSKCGKYTENFVVAGAARENPPITIDKNAIGPLSKSSDIEIPPIKIELGSKLPPPGEKTDNCFLEIRGYNMVLQATAMEINSTLESCKCSCTLASSKYQFLCTAVEYYFETKVCLLFRQNRAHNPTAFGRSKLGDERQLSYFDMLCVDDNTKLGTYKESSCGKFDEDQSEKRHESPSSTLSLTTVSSIAQSTVIQSITVKQSSIPPNDTFTTEKAISKQSESKSDSISTPSTTTELPAGSCRYSTYYASKFNGRRLLEKSLVDHPLTCLKKCAAKQCKSANFQNFIGKYKFCEIFEDSAVDYPTIHSLTFRTDSVYFDGISCETPYERKV